MRKKYEKIVGKEDRKNIRRYVGWFFLFYFFFGWLNLFADMRMSSSMYEVFNWNYSPDPSLTQVKNKRVNLSLPPTSDNLDYDDKFECEIRRSTIHRATSGELAEFNVSIQLKTLICIREYHYFIF